MRILRVIAATSLASASFACGDADGKRGTPALLWSADATSIDNPWPSDRLLANGVAGTPAGYFTRPLPPDDPGYDEPRQFLENAVAVLGSSLGAYSVYAPIVMPASGEVDVDLLAGAVHLFPEAGGNETELRLSWSDALGALLAEPVRPLRGSRRYVVIVSGAGAKAAPAFEAARDTDPETMALADLAVSRGIAGTRGDVDLAFAFTTQAVEEDLLAVQGRIDGPPGDGLLPFFSGLEDLPFDAGVSTSGSLAFHASFDAANADTAGIATIAQGWFDALDFRGEDGSFDAALVHGTGALAHTAVDFRLAVPAGPPPPGGWPIVMASHGLFGDSVEALQRSYSFALAGAATIGSTATDHGWRGSILDFFDFRRPLYVRDGFRQSTAEILQLQRLVRNAHDAGLPPFDQLDPESMTYFGNSFGGILGGGVAAGSAHVDAVGFAVSGGRLPRLFEGDTGLLLLQLFGSQIQIGVNDERFPAFLESFEIVAQWAIDPADPGALAPAVPAERPILIQIALGDAIFLNESSEDLRLALDLPLLDEPADPLPGRGAAWVWDVADYPDVGADPHDLYWDLVPMRIQMETFLLTEGTVLTGADGAAR